MKQVKAGEHRLHSGWWAVILLAVLAVFAGATITAFAGTFRSFVPVTLTSDRAGLVMDPGARVKMRGVQVGQVASITSDHGPVDLTLEIDPDQIANIPANVQAQISVTTAFGSKFVDLIAPQRPSTARLAAGAVLVSKNVSTEVNTVFENVVDLLKMIDPAKLNAVLSAVADGVRGQGPRMGQATTDLDQVLTELNARSDTFRQDWRSFKNFNDTYNAAAENILSVLNAASTTSTTVVDHAAQLDSLLLNTLGFANSGTNLLTTGKDPLIGAINTLEPTTELLNKYNPVYTCFLQGATWFLDHGGRQVWGGNGKSIQLDIALLGGNDPYAYPDNLPIVAAKGGPGGQPGCGSLPDASKNFPVRQLITNTGWGTGVDIRPNPGIGHPCYADWLPTTRGTPQPPKIRQCLPGPAIGPEPYPGAPPYGAPLYGPGGVPLWPGIPPAPSAPPSNPLTAPLADANAAPPASTAAGDPPAAPPVAVPDPAPSATREPAAPAPPVPGPPPPTDDALPHP
jgi:phospholipid/cholesterol/gamma-HCH transport system substrate-binding protein